MTIGLIGMLAVDAVFGASTRDRVAAQVFANLRAACGEAAVIERVGAGDFVVVLPSTGNDRGTVNRILEAIGEPLNSPLGEVVIGFAVGVAVGDGLAPLLAIERAACNLEAAADRGPGRVEWTDEPRHTPRTTDRTTARRGIGFVASPSGGEATVRFQPVVSLRTGDVVEYEASTGWRPANHGSSPTRDPATGCWDPVVLASALDFLGQSPAADNGHSVRVSLNVCARELADPEFARAVLDELANADVPPSSLQLELVDRFDLARRTNLRRSAVTLRARGVRLALDDFGQDPEDLCILSDIDFDAIKLSSHLVAAHLDAHADQLLRSLVRLARQAGVDTVAKGVESPAQHERLFRAGCTYGQGPLYGHSEPYQIGKRSTVATASAWQGLEPANKRSATIRTIVASGSLDDGSTNAVLHPLVEVCDAKFVLFATNEPTPNHLVIESDLPNGIELAEKYAGHVRCVCEANEQPGALFELSHRAATGDQLIGAQVVDAAGVVLGALIVMCTQHVDSGLRATIARTCDRLAAALERVVNVPQRVCA
ncbi:MAG TPA: bifunctional diguanylate cyclase/phosphodiesterase [Ilumatobacteraceae bacterium]